MSNPALDALTAAGLDHRVIEHGPVRSLAEAAEARGVEPADVVKTLVVRRGDDDFVFVLVPGERTISCLLGRTVTLGAGRPGLAVAVDGDAALRVLDARIADITEPEPPADPPPHLRATSAP